MPHGIKKADVPNMCPIILRGGMDGVKLAPGKFGRQNTEIN